MNPADFIAKFDAVDQAVARELISAIQNISTDDMTSALRDIVLSIPRPNEKAALYVERELEGNNKAKQPIFLPAKGKAINPRHVPLVKPIRGRKKVGSEGVLARLASQISDMGDRIILSPGPNAIRKKCNRPRHIIIITDIIGSGTRIKHMLDAFEKVGTVRSWKSLKYHKFHVVAYASSDAGLRKVKNHKFRPEVHCYRALPTVRTEFFAPKDGVSLSDIVSLCHRYDPLASIAPNEPLGFGNVGALLTIGGCCPNNAPRLLWEQAGRWMPLYKKYVSTALIVHDEDPFERMSRILLASSKTWQIDKPQLRRVWAEARSLIVLLVSSRRKVRAIEDLAALTKLSFHQTKQLVMRATDLGWLDDKRRLTEEGRDVISIISRLREIKKDLPVGEEIIYLPQQLRAPVPPSSPAFRTVL